MIRLSLRRAQTLAIVLAALFLSSADAQTSVDPARRLMRQQIELAAAAYVRQTLKAERGQGSGVVGDLALDLRSTDARHHLDENAQRPAREAQHSAHLAQTLGTPLVDGQHVVTCASDDPGSCRFNNKHSGLLRMSIPRVHNDSARVVVDLLERGEGRTPVHRTTWDLLLVNGIGAWKVVPQRYMRSMN